jgi:chorismate dehydratase
MSWERTIGRVAFINCEPLFHGLNESWSVIPAPPSWLTGHLLRRDCIIAPIPAADYARHSDELTLVPDLAISSKGEVGSVLLFSNKKLASIKTIALPTDSTTSVTLLKHLMKSNGFEPEYHEMGPDLETMLSTCDACLLIGDRSLEAATENPELVKMDLGAEWKQLTGHPMVFGVFATRRDSPISIVKQAHAALLGRLESFESDTKIRREVIEISRKKTSQSIERLERYFGEVINRMDEEDLAGLSTFLTEACGSTDMPQMAW